MELTEKQVGDWVESLMDDSSLFVVDIEIKGDKGGKKKIAVYLDGDKGISIEQCSRISRKLSSLIEEEEPSFSRYTLEVSSYGVGRPLKLLRQYKNNVGRKVRLELQGGKQVEGTLKEVSEKGLVVERKKKKEIMTLSHDFDEIVNTQVLVSFK